MSYLVIKGSKKSKFDFWAPLTITILSVLTVLLIRPQLYMANGLFLQIGSMVQNLPGFYIAALAAVATYQREGLDRLLPYPTPYVNTLINGKWVKVELTRRRLLTSLFSYLSAISFVVYLSISFANSVAPIVKEHIDQNMHIIFYVAAAFSLWFFIWHMISVTMFGLYQLGERIFQGDI